MVLDKCKAERYPYRACCMEHGARFRLVASYFRLPVYWHEITCDHSDENINRLHFGAN